MKRNLILNSGRDSNNYMHCLDTISFFVGSFVTFHMVNFLCMRLADSDKKCGLWKFEHRCITKETVFQVLLFIVKLITSPRFQSYDAYFMCFFNS
jgi:hypothetical protein